MGLQEATARPQRQHNPTAAAQIAHTCAESNQAMPKLAPTAPKVLLPPAQLGATGTPRVAHANRYFRQHLRRLRRWQVCQPPPAPK